MRDVNVTRFDVNAVTALRACVLETMNETQKPGHPPNAEDVFDTICGFSSGHFRMRVIDRDLGPSADLGARQAMPRNPRDRVGE
jgi:hypothetical protein